MPLPTTGVDWEAVYGFNPLGLRKGIITNIIGRDYHGGLTNLADPLVGLNDDGDFTPYAADGGYRDDLLSVDFPGGQFYDFGALSDAGTKITADTTVEEGMIAQARRPQRYDLTKEGDSIQFILRETNPTTLKLWADKPLANIADAGKPGFVEKKPAEGDLIERQFIAFAEDGDHRFAYILPRVSRTKVGDNNLNKKDFHEFDLTYGAMMCPFAKYPVAIAIEGSGWRALAGAPLWSAVAPVASSTGPTAASVSFTRPTLTRDPAPDTFTYTVERKTGAGAFTTATIAAPTVVGNTVTIGVTGLTTATSYLFRVTATGTNTLSSVSASSNTITTS